MRLFLPPKGKSDDYYRAYAEGFGNGMLWGTFMLIAGVVVLVVLINAT